MWTFLSRSIWLPCLMALTRASSRASLMLKMSRSLNSQSFSCRSISSWIRRASAESLGMATSRERSAGLDRSWSPSHRVGPKTTAFFPDGRRNKATGRKSGLGASTPRSQRRPWERGSDPFSAPPHRRRRSKHLQRFLFIAANDKELVQLGLFRRLHGSADQCCTRPACRPRPGSSC